MSNYIANISLSKRMDFFEGVRIYDNLEVIGKTSCCKCSIIDGKDFLVTHGKFYFPIFIIINLMEAYNF